eukprot:CAMPEP_0184019770 /NCGR_PEP_ID=MMETSP0954-20121128/8950_1 /TAXON_ID=627963 /ORGANISM="Aplanochytrium sp, Strain PBS07" /LENGTH=392 /DNA_ID=CAMNT_0026301501 /DNA_START=389 /DNA_END=1567 /DNA_ORIENTATION=+
MILTAAAVLYLTPDAADTFEGETVGILDEADAASGAQQAGFALANALIVVGAITGMTFLIVLCIYMGWEKLFGAYIFLALLFLMGFTTGVVVVEGLRSYSVPIDVVTLAIFFYNFAVVGVISIFSFEVGLQGRERLIPLSITQVYLVIISTIMAWIVTNIFPEFTTWALLVCLALYDLCAVLTPCGPLNLLIQVVSKRQEDNPNSDGQMIPGLLYEVNTGRSYANREDQTFVPNRSGAAAAGPLAFMAEVSPLTQAEERVENEIEEEVAENEAEERVENGVGDRVENEVEHYQIPYQYEDMEPDSNLKLGLGDFVFYSVLSAKAAEFGFVAFVSVGCCILCGLCGTLILLAVYEKALPALPISIMLGVSVYLLANFYITPFVDELALEAVSV